MKLGGAAKLEMSSLEQTRGGRGTVRPWPGGH